MIYSSPRSALRHQNCAKVRQIARGAFCGSQLSFPRSPREHLAIFHIIIFFPPKHFALSPGKGFKILDCVMITEWEASGVAGRNAFRVQAEIRPRLKVEQESLASHTPDECRASHLHCQLQAREASNKVKSFSLAFSPSTPINLKISVDANWSQIYIFLIRPRFVFNTRHFTSSWKNQTISPRQRTKGVCFVLTPQCEVIDLIDLISLSTPTTTTPSVEMSSGLRTQRCWYSSISLRGFTSGSTKGNGLEAFRSSSFMHRSQTFRCHHFSMLFRPFFQVNPAQPVIRVKLFASCGLQGFRSIRELCLNCA